MLSLDVGSGGSGGMENHRDQISSRALRQIGLYFSRGA